MKSLPVLQSVAELAPRELAAQRSPGPLERQLEELWPVARARLSRWGTLRASLSLHRRFHLRLLRVGELRIAVPTGKLPDCDSCLEVCCTGPNAVVSLRLRDVAALTDAGLERFIVRRERSSNPSHAPRPKTSTWARREADGSVFHQAFPVLARDATGTCALLTEERHCGAWPAWPLSCARYPYALDLQAKVIFWAAGCASHTLVAASEVAPRVRGLVRAVVDSYNARVKDIVMVHMARAELDDMGLLRHIDVASIESSGGRFR